MGTLVSMQSTCISEAVNIPIAIMHPAAVSCGFGLHHVPSNESTDHPRCRNNPSPAPLRHLLGHFQATWPAYTLLICPGRHVKGETYVSLLKSSYLTVDHLYIFAFFSSVGFPGELTTCCLRWTYCTPCLVEVLKRVYLFSAIRDGPMPYIISNNSRLEDRSLN